MMSILDVKMLLEYNRKIDPVFKFNVLVCAFFIEELKAILLRVIDD